MPLFSEHISNMYYSGTPSYTSPSYGYKSSYTPLGTSYSALYLSPGGSYSNHSSLSSYSRAPLSSRWISGTGRSYSPMLTPISERGTASPIRINSPRRIPISKRSYGTPSYIQRPININTESIDVSRDRYRPKATEPSPSAFVSPHQRDEPIKDTENGPFMPRVDGKPETGIDSSPGLQRSTIKRGRTVVRLHTVKRKEKDSPRKSVESSQMQDGEINKQDALLLPVDDVVPEESKESLRWREKLSEDLVYVDKKEKKSLGTKLVEKFIVKDVTEKDTKIDKSDIRNSEGTKILLPSFEVPPSSKSPDRRCSVEMLAEQASLLDSLIRGENLSTATIDLSKVGIADETKNKFDSSNSIKRRKIDDKGNPLKTTKSDHSLHDNLNKSLKGSKDYKILTKRRSLKKSHSGGSICRLDSITEFPKEPKQNDLPAIEENRFSPKEQKTGKPKLRTKITASVEISPPISPLKFRIENITVEEKHNTPKKEISFSYDVDETPIQDVTLQSPKTTLRRTKERNSVKKKSSKIAVTEPISPEPDDGNFWAKIGKRETVYLIKRKQNIEAAREHDKKSFLWFPENEVTDDVFSEPITNDSNVLVENNISLNQSSSSDLIHKFEPINMLPKEINIDVDEVSDEKRLSTISSKLGKSKSSDNIQKNNLNANNSLKENAMKPIIEPIHEDLENSGEKSTLKKIFRQDAETKENFPEEKNERDKTDDPKLSSTIADIVQTKTNQSSKNSLDISQSVLLLPMKESPCPDETSNLYSDLKVKSKGIEVIKSVQPKDDLNNAIEAHNLAEKDLTILAGNIELIKTDSQPNADVTKVSSPKKKISPAITAPTQTEAKHEDNILDKDSKPVTENRQIIESTKTNLSPSPLTEAETTSVNLASPLKSRAKSEGKNLEIIPLAENMGTDNNPSVDVDLSTKIPDPENKLKSVMVTIHTRAKSEDTNLDNDFKSVGINFSSKTLAKIKPVTSVSTVQNQAKSEAKSIVDDLKILSEKVELIKSDVRDESSTDISFSSDENSTKPDTKQANTVLTLQTQAKSKVAGKQPELLVKTKQVEPINDAKSSVKKQKIPEITKKNTLTETNKSNSKKKVNKLEVQVVEKNKDKEKISSTPKGNICETCKKSLETESSKTKKLNITKSNDPSKLKPLQMKDKVPTNTATSDKPTNNVQVAKPVIDSSIENLSDSNLNTENSASTSQMPIVIENKNIPMKTVESDTELVQTSVPSQKKTGEDKAENYTKGDEDSNKLKQPSIKEAATIRPKIPVKEERAAKPLIATPRPLQKRAPQVIQSDTSGSSSEEDSSEEDSETSEDSAEFYECDNNPDGRTSTGSNDSGFDSSAPTSPASFLQIKKDCDVNCHRKCEKLTANLCGVNQRLLVEALATRTASKKGGDSPGPSSSNASSQLPETDVGDSELELEQSTAYGIFRKTGKFTPPAKSIPRFRKYNIEDFQFIKVLGKGSFGKVLLAELRDTEYYYAVKCLKKDVVLEDDDVECTLIERKVLALGTNHPYLCHLFATFQTDAHLFFVMEYLNGGDLMFHIQQSGRFPEARARFYAAEIVSGLKFLHKRGIVYRDLKLDNILLDYEGHVRIADFGMCKLQIYLDKTADTFCGTPDYMAPEIIKGLKYNQTVDWWSFGVLLYEMLIGQSPFSGCDEDELFWSICNEMPSYPRFLSRESLTILTRLLDKDARTRLGGTECMHGDVREQEFFHPIHWDKMERRELETPFKPRVRHPLDTQYFDRAFTGERPRLTAVEPHVLRSMDQTPFRGFSYTNPNATDR